MSADYKVTAKIGEADEPLLLLTIRVEHQLVLDSDRIKELIQLVHDLKEVREISTAGENIWLDMLDSFNVMLESPDSALGLESPWREIPHQAAAKLVEKAALQHKSELGVFLEGAPPTFSVVFNINDVSFRTPLPSNQLDLAEKELMLVKTTAEMLEREGRPQKERSKVFRDLVTAGDLTLDFVGCAASVGAAVGSGPGGAIVFGTLAINSCVDAINSARAVLEAQKARDRAKRESAKRQREHVSREDAVPIMIENDRIGGIDVSTVA